ncbi:hypothetical protein LTR78_003087 [Recurvomyces mirabilis]|uniref:AB hydrolase-1 domain-containing protein n=1 Tax=Recurvomyces mirabilis TaxID=574656 RepID=A0AAE0WS86_9PEZI|nr:hypothetical protein LTR78_003087 [Recurvomyces mirabilis]KAK5157091.1 hypothetical protein LTS14_004609 [Recurvomyces mirabilis]
MATSCHYQSKKGYEIQYKLSGSQKGRLLVLLHGLGGSNDTFVPLIPHLPLSSYKIVAVDFLGFGNSQLQDSSIPLSVAGYVSDLDDLITSLQSTGSDTSPTNKPEAVVIVGHSLGSIVALHYAASRPDNVAGLGLIGVGRSASHIPAVKDRMYALAGTVRTQGIDAAARLAMQTNFPPGSDTPDADREEVRRAVATSDPEGYAQVCEAMVNPRHKDPNYSEIMCPAVFVSGEGDTISPPARATELAPLLGGRSKIFVVKGGHQPIISDVDGTRNALGELFWAIDA